MRPELLKEASIKQLQKNDIIPYKLLLDADPSKALVDQYLPDSEIYVVNYENKIVAVYVLYPLNAEVVEIKNIAVEDSFQGNGIGTWMLNDAFQRTKQKGFKEIRIGTANSSVGQLYLYQKVGFEIIELRKNFFTDHYPVPLYENGLMVRDMIVLSKKI